MTEVIEWQVGFVCSLDVQDGYQTLPDSDEERGKGPASSQGDKEAHREEVQL